MTKRAKSKGETRLHADLKAWYGRSGGVLEQIVDGYVIDLVRADELVEIQTRTLGALKEKLQSLLVKHVVRVVHPIANERWILRIDRNGVISRRKSPRKGTALHLIDELINLHGVLDHPNLRIEAVMIQEEQVWRDDGLGSWRRKHWSLADRRLLAVVNSIQFDAPGDYLKLIPDGLPDLWTTLDLSRELQKNMPPASARKLAGKLAYVLRRLDLITQVGKSGKAYLYSMSK